METARRLHEKHELLKEKQQYLDKLGIFLSQTMDMFIQLHIDENEHIQAQVNGNKFEYSVWGDNNNGMFRDTLRSLIREGYMEELY